MCVEKWSRQNHLHHWQAQYCQDLPIKRNQLCFHKNKKKKYLRFPPQPFTADKFAWIFSALLNRRSASPYLFTPPSKLLLKGWKVCLELASAGISNEASVAAPRLLRSLILPFFFLLRKLLTRWPGETFANYNNKINVMSKIIAHQTLFDGGEGAGKKGPNL